MALNRDVLSYIREYLTVSEIDAIRSVNDYFYENMGEPTINERLLYSSKKFMESFNSMNSMTSINGPFDNRNMVYRSTVDSLFSSMLYLASDSDKIKFIYEYLDHNLNIVEIMIDHIADHTIINKYMFMILAKKFSQGIKLSRDYDILDEDKCENIQDPHIHALLMQLILGCLSDNNQKFFTDECSQLEPEDIWCCVYRMYFPY